MSSFYDIYCVHPVGVTSHKPILKNQRAVCASFSRPSRGESTDSREENQVPTKENLKVAEENLEAEKMSTEITTSAEEVTSSEKVTEVTTESANENQSAEVATPGEMVEITKELAEKIQSENAESKDEGLPDENKNSSQTNQTHIIKRISRYTIETMGLISAEDLEAHGIIRRAKVSGYVCPICGSGSGPNGTGMEYNKTVTDHTSFTCFSGNHSFVACG